MKSISLLLSFIFILTSFVQNEYQLDFDNELTHQIGAKSRIDILYWSNQRVCYDSSHHSNSYSELERLSKFHKKYPSYVLEIGVHSDSRGKDTHNLKLTQKRAESILFDLHERFGSDTSKFIAKGYGESISIISNSEILNTEYSEKKEELHRVNQRTEMTLLKK